MIYLFDIDGTLTSPRQSITREFEEYFYNWMLNKKVFLVTGSDRAKVNEQLSSRIIRASSGIFCSMANELYVIDYLDDKLVYSNSLKLPEQLSGWLEQYLQVSEYPEKTGNHFEYRPGMLNFSTIGRNATKEQRERYYKWDMANGERNFIAGYINNKFGNEIEACVGGQISIDIQGKGKNKSQASQWIRQNIGDRMHFFGDRCEKGGNDFDIVKDITDHGDGTWTHVFEPTHLMQILRTIE